VVALLHGLTAAADLNWFGVFGGLAGAGFRVLSVEHRGYARGAPRAGGRCRLGDLADDLVAVADSLGIDRLVPVGYSMGGAVAQLVWRRHPERVAGLVLGATAAEFAVSVRERVLSAMLPAASAGARMAPGLAGRFVGGTLRARFAKDVCNEGNRRHLAASSLLPPRTIEVRSLGSERLILNSERQRPRARNLLRRNMRMLNKWTSPTPILMIQ